jgi:hypothetical protein
MAASSRAKRASCAATRAEAAEWASRRSSFLFSRFDEKKPGLVESNQLLLWRLLKLHKEGTSFFFIITILSFSM